MSCCRCKPCTTSGQQALLAKEQLQRQHKVTLLLMQKQLRQPQRRPAARRVASEASAGSVVQRLLRLLRMKLLLLPLRRRMSCLARFALTARKQQQLPRLSKLRCADCRHNRLCHRRAVTLCFALAVLPHRFASHATSTGCLFMSTLFSTRSGEARCKRNTCDIYGVVFCCRTSPHVMVRWCCLLRTSHPSRKPSSSSASQEG